MPSLTHAEKQYWIARLAHTAFGESCRIQERLANDPVLDEQDDGRRQYQATLANYRDETWRLKDELPQGGEGEVYSWFGDYGQDYYVANRDVPGGHAPHEAIRAALPDLALSSNVGVEK